MKRVSAAVLVVVAVALTGCGESADAGLAGNEAQVLRSELGGRWPLTVPSGVIRCDGSRRVGRAVFIAPDGTEYALNGLAANDYPDIDPIWLYEPGLKKSELRMNIGPLVDRALRLC